MAHTPSQAARRHLATHPNRHAVETAEPTPINWDRFHDRHTDRHAEWDRDLRIDPLYEDEFRRDGV